MNFTLDNFTIVACCVIFIAILLLSLQHAYMWQTRVTKTCPREDMDRPVAFNHFIPKCAGNIHRHNKGLNVF